MAKKIGIPGSLQTFEERTGGYINYQYNTSEPEKNNPDFMLDEEEAKQMLRDANEFLRKHFPWMKDFSVFQLSDGTVRLDVADRAFLGGD